jgi:hypothetical protein
MPYDQAVLAKHRESMKRGDEVPVALVTFEEQRAEGVLRVQRLSPHERGARARKWLLVCLALAPLTAVCPPHFPWPIITILVGVIGAYLRRGRSELVLGGEGKCPKCGAFQILESGNAEFPMAHFCSECHERSLVTPTNAAA